LGLKTVVGKDGSVYIESQNNPGFVSRVSGKMGPDGEYQSQVDRTYTINPLNPNQMTENKVSREWEPEIRRQNPGWNPGNDASFHAQTSDARGSDDPSGNQRFGRTNWPNAPLVRTAFEASATVTSNGAAALGAVVKAPESGVSTSAPSSIVDRLAATGAKIAPPILKVFT
jgi:hypothetical protein